MKGNETIPEESISLDQAGEIGGLTRLDISSICEPIQVRIKEAKAFKTQWGNRIDYTIESTDGFDYILSSWNFACKARFKPAELIGKMVSLRPYNDKKLFMDSI